MAHASNAGPTGIGRGVRDSQSEQIDGPDIQQTPARAQDQRVLVAEWPKNARERLRVSLDLYHGNWVVGVRVWFTADDGSERPGRSGLTVGVRHLPNLSDAFAKALVEARRLGLIDDDEPGR